jgi:hypothetical protein
MSVRDLDRRVRRVVSLIGSIKEPRDADPRRPLDLWTTGERRRRLDQLRADAAAEFGIDPLDVDAVEAAIESDGDRAQLELAAELGVPPDHEASVYLAAAKRAAALGDRELAARFRRLAAEAAPGKTAP